MTDRDKSKSDFSRLGESALIGGLGKITEISPQTIRACQYEREELVDIFERAVHYQDSITCAHKEIEKLPVEYSVRLPAGPYASSSRGTFYENAVTAAQLGAKITGYESALTRLAQDITARAILRSLKSP
jgi:hypothetical protein